MAVGIEFLISQGHPPDAVGDYGLVQVFTFQRLACARLKAAYGGSEEKPMATGSEAASGEDAIKYSRDRLLLKHSKHTRRGKAHRGRAR